MVEEVARVVAVRGPDAEVLDMWAIEAASDLENSVSITHMITHYASPRGRGDLRSPA